LSELQVTMTHNFDNYLCSAFFSKVVASGQLAWLLLLLLLLSFILAPEKKIYSKYFTTKRLQAHLISSM